MCEVIEDIRLCQECTQPFKWDKRRTIFCSTTCYKISKRKNKEVSRERKTHYHKCKYCGNDFKREKLNHIYCSKYCGNQASLTRRVEANCFTCGNPVLIKHNSITKRHFCSRECFINLGLQEGRTKVTRSSKIGKNILQDASCAGCGLDQYYLLELHHIDSDRTNNVLSNLEIVCRNCHSKRHMKKNKNNLWVVDHRVLTDRSLLSSIP